MALFQSNRILTLDVGASKIVLAEFLAAKAGAPQLVNYGITHLDVGSDLESDPSAFIVAAIRELMRERRIKPAPVLMSISGQTVFPRYVKVPPVGRDKFMQMIRYEAEQNVPFPINEVVWDYETVGEAAAGEEQSVMLVAVKIENVKRLTDCVQAAGLEPEIVDVAPLALFNAVRFNYPNLEGCTMVLDIGARSSNLTFVEQDRIFSRSIPVAGNTITLDLMKELDVEFKEAEDLKKTQGFVALGGVYAGPENPIADRVSRTVRSVLTRLHAEVSRSINFYRSQQGGSPPGQVLLAGGTSIMPHMDTFFKEKLKVPVEYLNPFIHVPVGADLDQEAVGRDVHLLGEVTGLALRRSLTCPVEINLMPPDLVARKTLRRRQPFFVISAIGFVLIMLCWWVYFLRMKDMLRVRAATVEERVGGLNGQANRLNVVKAQGDVVRAQSADLTRLLALRTRWIEMLGAVHGCLLDGMWLKSVTPVVEGGQVVALDISGFGFLDILTNTAEATATEQLCNRLKGLGIFAAERTRITREPVVNAEDFAREFTIRAELKEPLRVADEGAAAAPGQN